jgi:GTPase Era involved in 16S rRNA processing
MRHIIKAKHNTAEYISRVYTRRETSVLYPPPVHIITLTLPFLNLQVIFLDTPGIMRERDMTQQSSVVVHEPRLYMDVEASMNKATVIMVVVDASGESIKTHKKRDVELHPRVLYALHK